MPELPSQAEHAMTICLLHLSIASTSTITVLASNITIIVIIIIGIIGITNVTTVVIVIIAIIIARAQPPWPTVRLVLPVTLADVVVRDTLRPIAENWRETLICWRASGPLRTSNIESRRQAGPKGGA
jgi:hypothetical protein